MQNTKCLEAFFARRPSVKEEPQGWERESDKSCDRYAGECYEYEMREGGIIKLKESFEDLGVRPVI